MHKKKLVNKYLFSLVLVGVMSIFLQAADFDVFAKITGKINLINFGNGIHQLKDDPGYSDPLSFYHRDNNNNNNNKDFYYLDIDQNSITFNSSMAGIKLAAGAEIVYASLHWGGRYDENNGAYDPDDFTPIGMSNGPMPVKDYNIEEALISDDGGVNYTTIHAQSYHASPNNGISEGGFYSCASDITEYVNSHIQNNEINLTVANLKVKGPTVSDGRSAEGGWSVQLVYALPTLDIGTATIYSGSTHPAGGTGRYEMTLSGFETPPNASNGPVITIMAGDGDKGRGDTFEFGNAGSLVKIKDDLHSEDDVLNSRNTISYVDAQGNIAVKYVTDETRLPRNPIRDRDVQDLMRIEYATPILIPGSTEVTLGFTRAGNEGIGYYSIGLLFSAIAKDFGDAPDSYGTDSNTSNNNGLAPVVHIIDNSSVHLGDKIPDADDVTDINDSASLDDKDLNSVIYDDEDGVSMDLIFPQAAGIYQVPVKVVGIGVLNAWFDANQNGIFDNDENLTTANKSVSDETINLSLEIPQNVQIGSTYLRIRVCSDGLPNGCATPNGEAEDGEVEDYKVTIENSAPTATDNNNTTPEDTPVSGNLLTDNDGNGIDSDPENDILTVTKFTVNGTEYTAGQTANLTEGTLQVNADGSYTFTPAANFNGDMPQATYEISDGNGGTDTAHLDIKVTPTNDAPTATDNNNTTPEDTPVSGNLLTDNDGNGIDSDPENDTLTVTKFTVNGTEYTAGQTANLTEGTLQVNADGSYTFTPAVNFNGDMPQATYEISDGNGGTDTAHLDIEVTPVNDAPTATDNNNTTPEDTPVSGNLLTDNDGNGIDSDPENDTLTVTKFTVNGTEYTAGQTANLTEGTLQVNADGSYTFTPAVNFNGDMPQATYEISDGNGGTDTAHLDIKVTPSNDADKSFILGNVSKKDKNGKLKPIANVTLVLFDKYGNEVDRTTTNIHGNYKFEVSPGNYYIQEAQPNGYYDVSENDGGSDNDAPNSLLNTISVVVSIGETDVHNDFVESSTSEGCGCAPTPVIPCAICTQGFYTAHTHNVKDNSAEVHWVDSYYEIVYDLYLNGKFIATVSEDTTRYTFKNLQTGTEYTAVIIANNGYGGKTRQTVKFRTTDSLGWLPVVYHILFN